MRKFCTLLQEKEFDLPRRYTAQDIRTTRISDDWPVLYHQSPYNARVGWLMPA